MVKAFIGILECDEISMVLMFIESKKIKMRYKVFKVNYTV